MNFGTPSSTSNKFAETPSMLTPGSLSQTPSQGGQGQQQERSLVPCTIKQLQKFCKNGFMHGKKLTTISLMGYVMSLERSETSLEMNIDDSTGISKCTWWADSDTTKNISKGQYLCMFGRYSENNFIVHNARPLKSMNEMTLHLLDVMLSHSVLSKQAQVPVAGQAGVTGLTKNVDFEGSKPEAETKEKLDLGDLNDEPYVMDIVKVIKASTNEAGLSITEIIKQTGKVGDSVHAEIKSTICKMEDQGIIAATLDDDHFQWAL